MFGDPLWGKRARNVPVETAVRLASQRDPERPLMIVSEGRGRNLYRWVVCSVLTRGLLAVTNGDVFSFRFAPVSSAAMK